jgi:hypothetical protein
MKLSRRQRKMRRRTRRRGGMMRALGRLTKFDVCRDLLQRLFVLIDTYIKKYPTIDVISGLIDNMTAALVTITDTESAINHLMYPIIHPSQPPEFQIIRNTPYLALQCHKLLNKLLAEIGDGTSLTKSDMIKIHNNLWSTKGVLEQNILYKRSELLAYDLHPHESIENWEKVNAKFSITRDNGASNDGANFSES